MDSLNLCFFILALRCLVSYYARFGIEEQERRRAVVVGEIIPLLVVVKMQIVATIFIEERVGVPVTYSFPLLLFHIYL